MCRRDWRAVMRLEATNVVVPQPMTAAQSSRQATWLLVTRIPVRSITFNFAIGEGPHRPSQPLPHQTAVELAIVPQMLAPSARTLEVRCHSALRTLMR